MTTKTYTLYRISNTVHLADLIYTRTYAFNVLIKNNPGISLPLEYFLGWL